MKAIAILLAAAVAATAHATIPVLDRNFNEAARQVNGRVVVDPPPGPRSLNPKQLELPGNPWRPDVMQPSYVIETAEGLKECLWPWLDGKCRDYVKGRDTRARGWVVKFSGKWWVCPQRGTKAGCSDYYLPVTAPQD